MNVYIYSDPDFRGSLWWTQTRTAIESESTRKKYGVIEFSPEDIETGKAASFFEKDEKRVLIVLTTEASPDRSVLEFADAENVHLLFVNRGGADVSPLHSRISVDYSGAMRKLTDYLVSAGRSRIALYAINPNSVTDREKERFFLGNSGFDASANIFYNGNGLEACYRSFADEIERFDSVICANDVAAVSLILNLQENGYGVPGDLYVASFGNSILSRAGVMPLTNVTVNHDEIGRQAFLAYTYLKKPCVSVTVTAKIGAELNIRTSTAGAPDRSALMTPNNSPEPKKLKEQFYEDGPAVDIFRVENMLSHCDRTDFMIISCLLENMTYEETADRVFTSKNTVTYRLKKILGESGAAGREELTGMLRRYVNPENIKEYLKNWTPD